MHDGRAFFPEIDAFLQEYDFELFDLEPFYWKRKNGIEYGGPQGQLIFANALYFKSLRSIEDALKRGERGKEYDKTKILKAISISILYGYLDRVYDLFAAYRDLFFPAEQEILLSVLKRQVPPAAKLPNFRGRGRLYNLANKIANLIKPQGHGWADSPTKLGNIQ